jgi:hypothetical protein
VDEGTHTFAVRASDAAGNPDPEPAEYTWTVDVTAPVVTITDGPAGTSTADTSATFGLVVDDASATLACALDDAAVDCADLAFSDLALGLHTLTASATDAAGNSDSDSVSWTVVDADAPETTIDSGPAALTKDTSASVRFSADEAGSTFECALDGADFAACTSPEALTGLAHGSHTFAVRASDDAGNTDASPATHTWTVDTLAPETTITGEPTGTVADDGASLVLGPSEGGTTTFVCSLDGADFAACPGTVSLADLNEGAHTFRARAIDAVGNVDASPAEATWTVDVTAPVVSITAGPDDLTKQTSAHFTFSVGEPGAETECSLDDGLFGPCASPAEHFGLADGEHHFRVRAIDRAGNTASDSVTWRIDTVAPTTTITDRPANDTNARTATFGFTSNDPAASFECSLGGEETDPWSSCTSTHTIGDLADGEHRFRVRATDEAGNRGPAELDQWTVDTAAPRTSIDNGPSGPVNQADASFAFSSDDPGASFECRLGGEETDPWDPCTSPLDYTGLADGTYTIKVRATDAAGNTDDSPAERTWTVDTIGPEAHIYDGPQGWTRATDATFTFGAGQNVTYECKIAGDGAFEACTSPATYTGLPDGEHTFRVRAIDDLGNTGAAAEQSWKVDTRAPVTTIGQKPDKHTQARRAEFTFEADEPADRFECKLVSADDTIPFDPCQSPRVWTDLADGTYIVRVRAVDRAGNTGEPDQWTWTVDTRAPVATIDDGPNTNTGNQTATFRFSSDEEGSFECRRDGQETWDACASPHDYLDLGLGEHVFRVRAVDRAGNTGEPDTHDWTIVDNDAPVTTLTDKPARNTKDRTARFVFEANEAVDRFECKLGGDETLAYAACTSPHLMDALPDGDYIFRVRAIDVAGNQGEPAIHEWSVDNRAPVTTIGQKPDKTTQQRRAVFTFDANEPVERFECRRDEQADWHACTSPHEYPDLGLGEHAFRVRATDRAGNIGEPDAYTWTIEAPPACTPGTVTVEAGADSWILQSSQDKNHGRDGDMKVTSKNRGNARSVVRFPLPDVPAGCVVTDARLRLWATSWKSGRTLQAIRLTAGWDETQITWRNQPGTVGNAAETAATKDWMAWTVTAQTRSLYQDGNHGFLIRDKAEGNGGAEQVFHTREKSERRPELVITFGPPS